MDRKGFKIFIDSENTILLDTCLA